MTKPHRIWGPELTEYVGSYDATRALHGPIDLDVDVRLEGELNILDIRELVENTAGLDSGAIADQFPLSTLKSVLRMALDPDMLHLFAFPSIIGGCIKLMSIVKQSGKTSPFSYEYGYLCFRILTISLSACLLERSYCLDDTADYMLSEPNKSVLQILSERVSKVVQREIISAAGGRHCDYILGWVRLKDHSPREALVSRPDASMLLDLLWTDRKYFLKALTLTYSPGLSGVMFLLWRYWHLERVANQDDDAKHILTPLCEILWRYFLVAPTDQDLALIPIYNNIGQRTMLWEEKLVDLEDCRTILCAYNNRLSTTNSVLYAPPELSALPVLLAFVVRFAHPGVGDLVPSMFGLTIRCMWDQLLDNNPMQEIMRLDSIRRVFLGFTNLLDDTLRGTNPAIIREFVETLVQTDFIGLMARIVLILKPPAGRTDPETAKNASLLTVVETWFESLEEVVPRQLLESAFDEPFPDWLKYRFHLLWRQVATKSPDESIHFRLCSGFWNQMAELLQQRRNIGVVRELPAVCRYARCPDPLGMSGSRFSCSKCGAPYCSARCQAADWMHGDCQTPHKNICGKSVKLASVSV